MALPQVGVEAVIENLAGFTKGATTVTKAYDQMDAGATKVEKSTGGLGSMLGSVGGGLLSFGKVAAGVALGGVTLLGGGLVALGTKAVLSAADVGEMQSLFNTAFGQDAPKARAEIDEFAAAVGRNKFELEGFAGSIKSLITPMGVTAEAGNEMSIELSKLSVDLSSFFNVTESDALDALKAGLIGETEPLRKFGIVLNAAAIEQQALNMGLFDGKGEMTAATKAAATYALIMEQTQMAQGDAARTSGSWVNQTRALKAAIDETVVSIGMELLPVVTPLLMQFTQMVKDVLPKVVGLFKSVISTVSDLAGLFAEEFLSNFGNDFGFLGQIVAGVEAILGEFLPEELLDKIYDFDTAIMKLATKVFGEFENSTFDLGAILQNILGVALDLLTNVILPALTTAINFVVDNWDTFKAVIVEAVARVKAVAIPAFELIGTIITDYVIPAVQDIVKWFKSDMPSGAKKVQSALKPIIDKILPELVDIFNIIYKWTIKNWPLIQKTIVTVLRFIEGQVKNFTRSVAYIWDNWGDDIMKVVTFVFKIVKVNLENMLDVVTLIMQIITGDWEGAWKTMGDIVKRSADLILDIVKASFDNIVKLVTTALNKAKDEAAKIWAAIVSETRKKAQEVYNAIKDKFNTFAGLIAGFASDMLSAAKKMMDGVINGVTSKANEIKNTITTTITNAVNNLKSAITGGSIASILLAAGQAIINKIKEGVAAITDLASKLISSVQGSINQLASAISSGSLYGILTNIGRNIMNKIIDGVKAITTLATELIARVQAAINSLSASSIFNALYSIGRDMIDGIIDGVRSMGSTLRGVLGDIVDDAIQAILEDLGIASPSKVFFGIGVDMMRGLSAGISALTPVVNAQLQAAVAAPTVAAPAAAGGGGVYNYNTFQLGGNNITNGMDVTTFEARVMRAVRRNL